MSETVYVCTFDSYIISLKKTNYHDLEISYG